ncbi:PAS domain S-box protein [Fulvivirga sediminis]|uniref:PAS domain S-box protein n=1 Tax=Fulvivirga sediminis TaxID=2803949 RepID=A0A937F3X4_9BACT|nr:PAS domain S-box protein [Fulvivirga sediminis]MBL3655892.1 PAS domain S-box protein [Fulvivirga sediminis]
MNMNNYFKGLGGILILGLIIGFLGFQYQLGNIRKQQSNLSLAEVVDVARTKTSKGRLGLEKLQDETQAFKQAELFAEAYEILNSAYEKKDDFYFKDNASSRLLKRAWIESKELNAQFSEEVAFNKTQIDDKAEKLTGTLNSLSASLTQTAEELESAIVTWTVILIVAELLLFIIMGVLVYIVYKENKKAASLSNKKLTSEENRIEKLTSYVEAISSGNFNHEIGLDIQEDKLAYTLSQMKDQILSNLEDNERRNWVNTGIAEFGEILRTDNNLNSLSERIVSKLVSYLNVNQGFLFVIEGTDGNQYLELKSAYAYERKKFMEKQISKGEGLVGQCWIEGNTIFMKEVPKSYVKITSGLGEAPPTCILIVPLKVQEDIYGVIELASFHTIKDYQIEFVEKLAESIASVISAAQINQTTKTLLEETQQQAEQLKSQEEEMRQNMEELQATQEEISRKSSEVESRMAAVDESGIASIEFDLDGIIRNANENFLKMMDYTMEEIEGKHHRIFVEREYGDSPEYLQFWKDLGKGKIHNGEYIRYDKNGNKVYIRGSYSVIKDNKGEPQSVLKLAINITDSKLANEELQQQAEEMKAQEEEMRQNMEELSATQEEIERILKEVQDNQQFMNDLINASADTIFTVDKQLNLLIYNSVFRNAWESQGIELKKGIPISQFFEEEEREKHMALIKKALEGVGTEIRSSKIIGDKTYYFHIIYNAIKNQEGEVVAAAVFAKDVTEEELANIKQNELLAETQEQAEQMRAQEEEMRQNMEELSATQEEVERILKEVEDNRQFIADVIDSTTDNVFTVDQNLKVVIFNKVFKNLWNDQGVHIEKGTPISDIFDEKEVEGHLSLMKKALSGEMMEVKVEKIIFNKTHYFNVIYSPIKNVDDEVIAAAIFAKDITETEEARIQQNELLAETQEQAEEMRAQEEELRQNMEELSATQEEMERIMAEVQKNEKYLKEVMNVIPDPLFTMDKEGKIVLFNEPFKEILAQNGNKVEAGKSFIDMQHTDDQKKDIRDIINKVFKGETLDFTIKYNTKQGEIHIYNFYCPIRDIKDNIVGVANYSRDITELVMAKKK